MMKVYALSDAGCVRPANEDSVCLPEAGETFCAVADGMGGHLAGEVASAMACEIFAGMMRLTLHPNANAMQDAIENANTAIFERANRESDKQGMGTTFTALSLDGNTIHIAHVGDSRAYRIRRGVIMRLTQDHTLVAEMVAQGLITSKEAKTHPKRHYITRAVGTKDEVNVDLLSFDLRKGDVFFLCSDGFSNEVDERTLLAVAQGEGSWQEKLETLVKMAKDAGGPDNISVMFVTFEEDEA